MPSKTTQAFLNAIAANPSDKLTFGVWADLLEEQGHNELAEFIRKHTTSTPSNPRPYWYKDRQSVIHSAESNENAKGNIGVYIGYSPDTGEDWGRTNPDTGKPVNFRNLHLDTPGNALELGFEDEKPNIQNAIHDSIDAIQQESPEQYSMYAHEYEKALKYSMETVKNLVSHEKPHEVAHIIADALEEDDKPTVAKYLRMAGEDAHEHIEGSYPRMYYPGTQVAVGKGAVAISGEHLIGKVLSGVRPKISGLLPKDMEVSHVSGDEENNPASYLNLLFKRHDGGQYHVKHAGIQDEHKEDLEKMVDEGIPGAEQALRNLKNVMGIYD